MEGRCEGIECGVCGKEIERPVVVPCGHSFCEICIGIKTNGNEFKCPGCLKYYNTEIVEFSKNYVLDSALKVIGKLRSDIKGIEIRLGVKEEEITVKMNAFVEMQESVERLKFALQTKEVEVAKALEENQNILSESISKSEEFKGMISEKSRELDECREDQRQNLRIVDEKSEKLRELEQKLEKKEKSLEIRFHENEIRNIEKEKELLSKLRELQLKEILVSNKEKQFQQATEKSRALEKDLQKLICNNQQIIKASKKFQDKNELLQIELSTLTKAAKKRKNLKPTNIPKFSRFRSAKESLNSTL